MKKAGTKAGTVRHVGDNNLGLAGLASSQRGLS
jgi:hypothetical protein